MIQKSDFEYLSEEIKESMPEWQATCASYNNPDEDNPLSIW